MPVEQCKQPLAADRVGVFAVGGAAEQRVLAELLQFDSFALQIDSHRDRTDPGIHWPLQSRRQSAGRFRHHCASSSMPTKRTPS